MSIISYYMMIEDTLKKITKKTKSVPEAFKQPMKALSDQLFDQNKTFPLEINAMIAFKQTSADQSIKDILIEKGLLSSFYETVNRSNRRYVLGGDISSEALCSLAAKGELEQIKEYTITPHLVNALIEDQAWKTGTPEFYFGHYNALMIAIAYRHLPVVRYFVETIGADLTIKGGRDKDLSMLACAGQPGNVITFFTGSFFPEVDPTLKSYLKDRSLSQSHENVSSYHACV